MPGAVAIVQARMSSTRLPGKSLAAVGGEPLLGLLLRRLDRAQTLARIVVATTRDRSDDDLAALASSCGVDVHRGPRDDVLTRFREVAAGHRGPIVRITGDCPLIDPSVVDLVVERFQSAPGAAYASNVEPRTYPRGLDVEVLSAQALERLDAEAKDPADREHVTSLLRRHPNRFPRLNVAHPVDLSHLRWTVDYQEDLEFLQGVIGRLGPRRYDAGLEEILRVVRDDPALTQSAARDPGPSPM